MKPLLVYLHGLNSSSQSFKAVQTTEYVHKHHLDMDLWVSDLPVFPSDILQCLQSRMTPEINQRDIFIIGSSLGGFLGTWLQNWLFSEGHQQKVRLVLVNPAVVPHERFEEYLGPQKNYHTGAEWVMTEEYVEQLILLDIKQLKKPGDVFLLVQTGDETLDYRQAVNRYSQCKTAIQEGGSHGFDDFDKMLPEIFDFLTSV